MSDALPIGHIVAGRYRITRFLGAGAMASVYAAEQEAEPRKVALKVMNNELSKNPSFVRRFEREAKAASVVRHPNSVRIITFGSSEGRNYIVMELLLGDSLASCLEKQGAFGQARAARILAEVADALAVAHELGIVHRDLKPENVMVISDQAAPYGERVKVLDFGIAKMLEPGHTGADSEPEQGVDPSTALTRAGTALGTPAYMSPEQCGLRPVDGRSDLYTCGVLLYQLVTGGVPFEGDSPLHTAAMHIHEPPAPPSTYAPHIDARLEAIILKALAKNPGERPQTARELAAALRKLAPELPEKPARRGGAPARAVRVGPPSSKSNGPAAHSETQLADMTPNLVRGEGSEPRRDGAKSVEPLVASSPSSGFDGPPARFWVRDPNQAMSDPNPSVPTLSPKAPQILGAALARGAATAASQGASPMAMSGDATSSGELASALAETPRAEGRQPRAGIALDRTDVMPPPSSDSDNQRTLLRESPAVAAGIKPAIPPGGRRTAQGVGMVGLTAADVAMAPTAHGSNPAMAAVRPPNAHQSNPAMAAVRAPNAHQSNPAMAAVQPAAASSADVATKPAEGRAPRAPTETLRSAKDFAGEGGGAQKPEVEVRGGDTPTNVAQRAAEAVAAGGRGNLKGLVSTIPIRAVKSPIPPPIDTGSSAGVVIVGAPRGDLAVDSTAQSQGVPETAPDVLVPRQLRPLATTLPMTTLPIGRGSPLGPLPDHSPESAEAPISGSRGLILGFLMGMVVMGVVAIIYYFLLRKH